MHTAKSVFYKLTLYFMSIMLLGGMPMIARAEEPATYTYDGTNQRWNTDKWVYDPVTKVYIPASTSETTAPPAASSDAPANGADGNVPASNATVVDHQNANQDTNANNSATIDNTLNSGSLSGGANVASNLKAGDAASGNADANTTTVNSIHSSMDGDTQGVAHFTTNIYGDVVGDIMIGPAIDNATIDRSININSNTNVSNDDAITNNMNIGAVSGDANVKGNNSAGSAKSGNANAVANVLNLINTIIAANKSFVGTINIYGNLNGDILVSPDFIPQLLASNGDNRVNISTSVTSDTNVNDDQSIINNIRLQATSGNANVKDNTGAGSATTGTANTNLTVLNLTGHAIDAKKCLLVFVNVLGKWVGMIVDAPGATAAAFGSNVINDTVTVNSHDNLTNKARITNNLNLLAKSGDANVHDNTSAGDATTGDATASANIANISTSTFKLSDWFGILFINVFGTWVGSFGVDTAAGTLVPLSGMSLSTGQADIGSPNIRLGFHPNGQTLPTIDYAALEKLTNGDESLKRQAIGLLSNPNQTPTPGAPLSASYNNGTDPLASIATTGGFAIAGISGAMMLLRRRRRVANEHAAARFLTGLALPS